ncbi:MAG: hypothetical protein JKY37_28360, partial [Nannocystaceae bacterium]|nr:hypothetical protein [Nannocystaceae bacterium]
QLRCGLFEAAEGRALAGEGPAASTATDNAQLVGLLFDAAMQLDGVSLISGSEDTVFAVPNADDPTVAAQLEAGEWSAFEVDLSTLGEAIAAHVTSFDSGPGRDALKAERDRRGCIATARYSVTPIISDLPACA